MPHPCPMIHSCWITEDCGSGSIYAMLCFSWYVALAAGDVLQLKGSWFYWGFIPKGVLDFLWSPSHHRVLTCTLCRCTASPNDYYPWEIHHGDSTFKPCKAMERHGHGHVKTAKNKLQFILMNQVRNSICNIPWGSLVMLKFARICLIL